MWVLLDECVDEQLRHHLPGHDCQTARYAGFAGFENGELLKQAEAAKFDVLLTVDRGFEYHRTWPIVKSRSLFSAENQFCLKTFCH
jgi:hypothetical protein